MIARPAETRTPQQTEAIDRPGFVAVTLDGIEIRQADGSPFTTPHAAAAMLIALTTAAALHRQGAATP
jgi:chaperone required for assembly of F1-ATPase